METQTLIGEIEAYCEAAGIAPSTFGLRVVNDGKFVERLRRGGGVTVRSLGRIRDYIDENPPAGR